MARDKFHPGKSQYKHWASLVAEKIQVLAPHSAA
jgi:lysophospholipase L1-like esterase